MKRQRKQSSEIKQQHGIQQVKHGADNKGPLRSLAGEEAVQNIKRHG